jgi:hypothetical protein
MFANGKAVRRHRAYMHYRTKKCNLCDFMTHADSLLDSHVKAKHEGIRDVGKMENVMFMGHLHSRFFASVSPSAMAPMPNCFLCFSRAITYVIEQRKPLGGGANTDGETDAKNVSVDGPLTMDYVSCHVYNATCAYKSQIELT